MIVVICDRAVFVQPAGVCDEAGLVTTMAAIAVAATR
jgi:hypothetical protein